MGLDNIILGFHVAITPFNLFVAVIGIVLGTIIGVLPGLGGANGVAILLPLTFRMPPTSAIILLTSLYWGALFGGAHVRRLPPGPAGAGRSGAHRVVYLILRGGALCHGPHHLLCTAPGGDRAEVRAAGVLCHPAAHVLELRRLGRREPAEDARLDRPRVHPRGGGPGHRDRAAPHDVRIDPSDDR